MKKVFISYADSNFYQSLKRIGKEAKELGIFDKIILYTPKDLPPYIKASPLMAFQRGGGYWVWKPYIIYKTLQDFPDGSVVCYCDAGCHLRKSEQWDDYFSKMQTNDALLFQYRANYSYAGWKERFGTNSVDIRTWTKPTTQTYFEKLYNSIVQDENTAECRGGNCVIIRKLWGGANFWKGKQNQLLYEWLSVTLLHPELVIDPFGAERASLPKDFVAHRHDQSILTPLAYYYEKMMPICLIPEVSESDRETAAISAMRLKQGKRDGWTIRTIKRIKKLLKKIGIRV